MLIGRIGKNSGLSLMTLGAPGGAMLEFPIEQSPLKTNILALFFAFNPLMAEDFFPFGQKFLIERRLLE